MLHSCWGATALGTGLLAFLAGTGAVLAAPADGIYEGTIGSASVIVSLDGDAGRYFYVGKGIDIFLKVSAKANALTVAEKSGDDDEKVAPTGLWSLSLSQESLAGTWSPPKGGKSVPIALKRVAPVEHQPDDFQSILIGAAKTPYEWRWLQTDRFVQGQPIAAGAGSYMLVRVSFFGIAVPRVVSIANAAIATAANRTLEQIHDRMILTARDNMNSARVSIASQQGKSVNAVSDKGTNSADPPKVTAFGGNAMSFIVTGLWDGGGAHPNSFLNAYTIDFSTGAEVKDTSEPQDPAPTTYFGGAIDVGTDQKRKAFDALWIGKLRKAVAAFKPSIAKEKDADQKEADSTCADDIMGGDFEGASLYELYLSDGGLAVHPDGWPNVAAYCFLSFAPVPVVLTPEDLKPFLSPGQKLIPAH